jgi:uncharacterized Zn-binding protein involved in type VI secretion
MKRHHITLGATTTAKGVVITATSLMSVNDARMALEGDAIACPACKSVGKIVCVEPRQPESSEGKKVALDKDLCVCKCRIPPKLIANQTLRYQTVEPRAMERLHGLTHATPERMQADQNYQMVKESQERMAARQPAVPQTQPTLESSKTLGSAGIGSLAHYIAGKGEPLQAHFSELGAENVRAEDSRKFREMVASNLPDGTYPFKDTIGWQSTSFDARAAYGRVELELEGTLVVSRGVYQFSGKLSAIPDKYDFDPQPWGERTKAGEISTRAGAMLPGTVFRNRFEGSRQIESQGVMGPKYE